MTARTPDYKKLRFVLILDGIRDPGNLGTLIRTADWFGVDAIMLVDRLRRSLQQQSPAKHNGLHF